jgi:alkanesulfonate monooxygenase SsuD/methylene tetrahydromethanopterin reductase-like flavin-dependent oxidoreductase (luciferase family)
MTRRVAWIKAAAGERFSALELNTFVFEVVITTDHQGAADQLAAAYGMTREDVLASLHFLVGTVDEVVEELTNWRAQLGISYVAVLGEESMEAFAPVVERLAGR